MRLKKFQNTLETLPKNTSLIIAVSGGVDSMMLLDVCLKSWKKDKISVVHINHTIR